MKYEITKEQLQELAKGNAKVERWFPEAFEVKPEIGKWYNIWGRLFFITRFKHSGAALGYGVEKGEWFNEENEDSSNVACNCQALKNAKPATESEVFEALKKEAVKRGFVEGVKYLSPIMKITNTVKGGLSCDLELNNLFSNNISIFNKGKWAEIIKEKTLSKSEAEAKLNELINDGYNYKID